MMIVFILFLVTSTPLSAGQGPPTGQLSRQQKKVFPIRSEMILFPLSLLICGVIVYVLGLLWFGNTRNRQLRSFFILGVEVVIWTLLNAVAMIVSPEFFPFVYTLRMVFVCIIPFGLLWFFLNYMETRLARSRVLFIIICAIPALDALAVVTNPLHHLMFRSYDYPMPPRGPLFWVHTALGFAAVILAFICLIRYIVKNVKQKPSVIFIAIGTLIPYALNMAYTFGVLKYKHDLTPIGFFVTIMLLAYSAYKSRLFDIRTTTLNTIFASFPDAVLVVDEEGIIMDANTALAEHFGSFPCAPGKSSVFALFAHLQAAGATSTPEELLEKTAVAHMVQTGGEFSLPGAGGALKTYTLSWRTIYTRRGRPSGYILTLSDVSGYRAMIDEMSRLKELAESASQAKSVFLANMSHEIRTPMNAIIGMASLAKSTTDIERKDYCIDQVEAASNHLLGVINDVLDMSKIEAGKLELLSETVDIAHLLQNVESVVLPQVQEKNQHYSVRLDPALPAHITTDGQHLAQVITNLLGNAVKFTPEGGDISLGIRLLSAKNDGATLQFEIRDTGIGIPEDQQARLFHSFEQADNGISRRFGGTGLGLAISKSIVEGLGGEIWVESQPGQGSRFCFTIVVQGGTAAAPPAPDEPADPDTYDFSGLHVLLAEDIAINREIAIALLEPTGLQIDSAVDGNEAFEKFQANPTAYDLIFMDIQMPGCDGYEAARLIRALGHPHAKSIPIIAMTANVFKEDIDRCLVAGMNDHVGKPLDVDDVLKKLGKHLPARQPAN